MVCLVACPARVAHRGTHGGAFDTGNQVTRISHPLRPIRRFSDTLSFRYV
jgi:hypothetical protein